MFTPTDEITASQTLLVPDKQTKKVSAALSFKNLDAIDYISVTKSGGNSYSNKISRSELIASYSFSYAIQPTDPESFKLLLKAHYKDGNASNILTLNVDNRRGFFIRSMQRVARVTVSPLVTNHFLTRIIQPANGMWVAPTWALFGRCNLTITGYFWRHIWTGLCSKCR
ncbi:hypothetical protein [Niabella hibiscisoli]|uniref:hypothetical protein n=1 Tax=Niabella hibiscisoli TaxID=1825928 RepID=UPI001F10C23B|nr:hypothetical protein [Niabella hibiscisoli]MCH5716598.1 hypothetical protein [Niabella hibiscisoli]